MNVLVEVCAELLHMGEYMRKGASVFQQCGIFKYGLCRPLLHTKLNLSFSWQMKGH